MSKKAIIITLISTSCVVLLVGLISFWMWTNQPTADIAFPPVPGQPTNAPAQKPPVPPSPIILGDAIDDGIVNALDINGLIVHWRETNSDYNVIDTQGGTPNTIDTADIVQVFGSWNCSESPSDKSCPYIN